MIHIGNQTSFAAATPIEPFDYAVANEFDAFEWFPDKKPGVGWEPGDLESALRKRIQQTANAHGMRLSVHARWGFDPLQPDSHPVFRADLELARDLGAVLLVIHLAHEQGIAAYVAAIAPLLQRAAEASVCLAIENTPLHPPELFNELFGRLRQLSSVPAAQAGMCLDLGHANLCAATRNDYLKFVDRLAPEVPIIHLHFHENWGDADTHLPLFTGPSARDDTGIRKLLEQLQRRNFTGSIILEQWPHPPSLLNLARDRLRQMLDRLAPKASESRASPHAEAQFTFDPGPEAQLRQPGEKTRPSGIVATREESAPLRPEERRTGEKEVPRSGTPEAASRTGAGKSSFAEALIASNQVSRSWREKLVSLRSLLAAENSPLTEGMLADIAVYLRLLRAGKIQCGEDGQHFRPDHHSRIAGEILEHLGRRTAPGNAFLLRKIYPSLPSSARTFQTREPLTRIRDIAHRNDIPPELKREIKDSLQNKLHRCAGPEDLITSARLLQRITAPTSNYPAAFVEQFRIFHEELKEFFHARSLEEHLRGLLPRVSSDTAGLIRSLLDRKRDALPPDQLAVLKLVTELRSHFACVIDPRAGVETQDILLADIGLEDFAFSLLSELINSLETRGFQSRWREGVDALRLAVTHLSLSAIEPDECAAIESELRAWTKAFDTAEREYWLRLKATVERSRRLAEDYCDRILRLFCDRTTRLGKDLGVERHSMSALCEADIRGHIIFQLSKLASGLLRSLRGELALPPWDVLMVGRATGRLITATHLGDLCQGSSEPIVVLLARAAGDEEIPRAVTGIVLAHDMPHLSHLGVRARQAEVVLVTCEEMSQFERLRPFAGQTVSLTATTEGVECTISPDPSTLRHFNQPIRIPNVELSPTNPCLPLEVATSERAGGKANGLRQLAQLAREPQAGFKIPSTWVVPFGVMEAALQAAPILQAQYRRHLEAIGTSSPEGTAILAEQLRGIIRQLDPPSMIGTRILSQFGPKARLIARSSSNCEDLPELAGAGLYESVVNLAPADVTTGVQTVWASLWTRRAAQSRRALGIPHEQAHMAVIIQQMLPPELSFVLHTVNPVSRSPREVYIEVAVGLGETLVSGGCRGYPYRLVCDKESGDAKVLAFANFSRALLASATGPLERKTVDYSRIRFSCDGAVRKQLASRLLAVARFLEKAFASALDIEGAIVSDEIYLLQARPQQGLGRNAQ